MLPSQNRKKENKMRISEEEMMEKLGLRLLIETVNGVDEQKLDHTYLRTVCGLSFPEVSELCNALGDLDYTYGRLDN